jgi:SAM-dependent methyltransferase
MGTLDKWVTGETNRALQSRAAVELACEQLELRSLPLHHDRPKNWDNFIALYHTVTTGLTAPGERVLDAGAGRDSVYLPGLKELGFSDLTGLNLDRHDDADAGVKDGIKYEYGDMTKTEYPSSHFDFVACLSVIEHGVDVGLFLHEMGRIIQPGGHLFVSFDYWKEKIDTSGLWTHDAAINIFSGEEVLALWDYALEVGFGLVGGMDLNCGEPIIEWAGLKYTFANLLFQRRPDE